MTEIEVRASTQNLQAIDDDKKVIEGYAVVFGSESQLLFEDDGTPFVETISRNAFENVDMTKVFALYNHDYSKILARSDAGNLELKVDDIGLWFRANLPDTTLAKDVYEDVRVGNVPACSFGFTVADDTWGNSNDGILKRTIKKIASLREITLTPYPAYESTTAVATRSYQDLENKSKREKELAELEKELMNMKLDSMRT
ncbi:HK97 family phage prohead protease [Vagococcus fessus]|nr:HK97 family phage prohead protease [Vagococcus fessus]